MVRSPIYQLMTFMLPMQTVDTQQRRISLPTLSVKAGPENMKNTGLLSAVNCVKRERYEWKAALVQKKNIMVFKR